MKPIKEFASWNMDNILGNMLQAETHWKNIKAYDDPNFAACINKHLLESQMELSELVAHDPDNADYYKDVIVEIRKLRKDNINMKLQPDEAIKRIRDIRNDFESHIPGHNVEECKSCGNADEIIGKLRDDTKDLNRDSNKLTISIQKKEINMEVIKPLVGNFVGKGISEATRMFVPGATFGVANKTLINLGLGLAIDVLALMGNKRKKILPTKMEVPLVGAANFLIADEVGDLVAGYMPTPAATVRAPTAAVRIASPAAAAGVSQFANGKHIFVD
jgi:hypothetical protein